MGKISDLHDVMLQSRLNVKLDCSNGVLPTKLYTHRNNVESENDAQLAKLTGRSYEENFYLSSFASHRFADTFTRQKILEQTITPRNRSPSLLCALHL